MNTYAQNYVSGTVKDNNGEPLLGVSIKVKDGNIVSGTVTDFNGHYQVKAIQVQLLNSVTSDLKQSSLQ